MTDTPDTPQDDTAIVPRGEFELAAEAAEPLASIDRQDPELLAEPKIDKDGVPWCDEINSNCPELDVSHEDKCCSHDLCLPAVRLMAERTAELEAANERLREGIMQIHEHHSIPKKHRHGSTTLLCESLLAAPQSGDKQSEGTEK